MRASSIPPATRRSRKLSRGRREDSDLAAKPSVTIDDLEERALIGNPSGGPDDGGGFDLRHAAGKAAESLNIAYLTDQPTTLVALVRAAFGIGVISQLALATTTIDGLAVRPIDSPTAFRDVALFWNEKDDGSPTLSAFADAVIDAPAPAAVHRLGD